MSGETRKALGVRLRGARRNRLNKMPAEEFGRQVARLIGRARPFSNVTVSNWETGRQEPSWEALVAIARLTRLPLRYFAGAGDLEDYPLEHWLEPKQDVLDSQSKTLVAAIQRLGPAQRKLVTRQAESLIEILRQETAAVLVSRPAKEKLH